MPFPSPSLPVPTLEPFEISYGGLPFAGVGGSTSRYNLGADGFAAGSFSIPKYITGDVQRAIDQGEFGGIDLSGGRDISASIVVKGTSPTDFDTALQTLAGVLPPQGEIELPLYVQRPSGIYACMAKPRGCDYPYGTSEVFALATVATCAWHATDPRWYLMPAFNQLATVPGPIGGIDFDITFDADFPEGHYGQLLDVQNNGRYESRPLLIISGPCVNPAVSNLSLPGSPTIGLNLTLNAGDRIVIDTDFQTVQLTAAGTTESVSRKNDLTSTTTWWNLPPGLNTIRFTTGDAEATSGSLTVQSASAFLGI